MDEVILVKEAYDSLSSEYDAKRYHKTARQRQSMLEQEFVRQRIRPGSRVLEVGCGTGRITGVLLEVASDVTAVDISGEMLNVLREKLGESNRLKLIQSDIFALDEHTPKEEFDAVVCMRVLPHLRNTAHALSILANLVPIGGKVLFDLWNNTSLLGIARRLLGRRHHIPTFHHTYDQMVRLVRSSSLEIEAEMPLWIYPSIGKVSLDGNAIPFLLKKYAYSMLFDTRRKELPA